MIKGKDEDRKFQRQCYYNIACMMVKNMPPVEDWLPVAYENEKAVVNPQQAWEEYQANLEQLNAVVWPKN